MADPDLPVVPEPDPDEEGLLLIVDLGPDDEPDEEVVDLPPAGITCRFIIPGYEEVAARPTWLPAHIGRSISGPARCTQPDLSEGNPLATCMAQFHHQACKFYQQVPPKIITRFATSESRSVALVEVAEYSHPDKINAQLTWRIWEYDGITPDTVPLPSPEYGQYPDLNSAVAALEAFDNLGPIAAAPQAPSYFAAIRA